MKMKKFNKIFLTGLLIVTSLAINGCNPFDDVYMTLSMETEFDTKAPVSNISIISDFCLTDFEDYNDNSEKIKEIKYISAAYFTLESSNGLQGDFKLRMYRTDTNALLFDYTVQSFYADSSLDKPLLINLNQEEINNINSYLTNPKVDKCFRAILDVNNAIDNDGAPFQLHGKVEFLTELQIEP
jgi:hypothetical protein